MRDGRTSYASQLRAIVLYRMAKNGKLVITSNVKSLLLLQRYPRDLTEDERERCEASVRSFLLVTLAQPNHPANETGWAAAFWRANAKISACERTGPIVLTEDDEADEDLADDAPAFVVSKLRDGFLAAIDGLEGELQPSKPRPSWTSSRQSPMRCEWASLRAKFDCCAAWSRTRIPGPTSARRITCAR